MNPSVPQESRDSSSPVITRAVASALLGRAFSVYSFPRWQRVALRLIGLMPQAFALWLIPRIQAASGLPAHDVIGLPVDHLIAARLADYDDLPGRFPAVVVGAGIGGATAHICQVLGAPFLPQAFVLTMQGGSEKGDAQEYFHRSDLLAKSITAANDGVMTIQHFDPVHDGWLTRSQNHLRIKLIDLPDHYRKFLRQKLSPGGDVVYCDCGASWLRYRTGARSIFQVGGWGDISPEEFLSGSDRLREYARKASFQHSSWQLQGFPIEAGPESEWGSEPGLGCALEEFCRQEGFRFRRIRFEKPEQFSQLAFWAAWKWIRSAGKEPTGTIIEMFSQFDPDTLQNGFLPLWLIFNTLDSARFLEEMVSCLPAELPTFFSALATFSMTPDLVPWREWERILSGRRWISAGARSSHYPADTLALVDWKKPVERWIQANAQPVAGSLDVDTFFEIYEDIWRGDVPRNLGRPVLSAVSKASMSDGEL